MSKVVLDGAALGGPGLRFFAHNVGPNGVRPITSGTSAAGPYRFVCGSAAFPECRFLPVGKVDVKSTSSPRRTVYLSTFS